MVPISLTCKGLKSPKMMHMDQPKGTHGGPKLNQASCHANQYLTVVAVAQLALNGKSFFLHEPFYIKIHETGF